MTDHTPTIRDVADVTGGLTKNAKRETYPARRPYLTVANVYANRLELDDVGEIGITDAEVPRVELIAGDLLRIHGRAAVVVPDNVLFEGGAGETIRRRLLAECDVHTLLRLPTGIFYAQGVKANVVFFDRKPASPNHWTRRLWVYDLRTNQHFTLKTNPMKRADLDEFVALYTSGAPHERAPTWSEATPEGRWRAYDYEEIVARDKCSLDLFWLKDDSLLDAENLPEPGEIAAEIAEDLRSALEQIEEILGDLEGRA